MVRQPSHHQQAEFGCFWLDVEEMSQNFRVLDCHSMIERDIDPDTIWFEVSANE
jgi:hypothetical protein